MTRKAQELTGDYARFFARGLSRKTASEYIGASLAGFDAMVDDGRMPQPKVVDDLLIWDRMSLDSHYYSVKQDAEHATEEPAPVPQMPKIYVLGIRGYVKIGFTTRALAQRITEMQTGCPHRLVVIKAWEGTKAEEIALHARFSKFRAKGEWFRRKGELADWIKGGCQP